MPDITVEELKTRQDAGEEIILIDVREPLEYQEFNLNGRLIPLGGLSALIQEGDLDEYKEEEIVVHCRSGKRSGVAKNLLEANGFTNVRNLLGGALDWLAKYGA